MFNTTDNTENYISFLGSVFGPHSFACSPLDYKFLFISFTNSSRRIFLMNFLDSTFSEIASGQSFYDPSWSHDGKMIAYGYSGEKEDGIYIQNLSDHTPKIVSDDSFLPRLPKWSYDNQKISFTAYSSPDSLSLYYVDLIKEKQHLIDTSGELNFFLGSWSYNSKYIIYHKKNGDDDYSIKIFNTDNGEKTVIINSNKELKYPVFSPGN